MAAYKHILASILVLVMGHRIFSQEDTTVGGMSLDLGITRMQNINLWPIYKKYRDSSYSEVQVLAGLYYKKRDFVKQTKQSRCLPFFISDSSSSGVDRRLASFFYPTIFRFQRDSTPEHKTRSVKFMELAPNISLLSFSKSPGGLQIENNILFFLWQKKDLVNEKSHLIVFPVYWSFANKKDSTQVLFPFYLKRNTAGKKETNIAFLYHHSKTAKKETRTLFPLWWNKKIFSSTDTIVKNTILPLYRSNQSDSVDNRVILPLLYSFKNNRSRSFTLFPLLSYGSKAGTNENYYVATPLVWHIRSKYVTKDAILPFYWASKNVIGADTIKTLTIFPLYWAKTEKNLKTKTLLPFMYSRVTPDKNQFTVLPFFTRQISHADSTGYLITPLFWHTESPLASKNIFFPLYWNSNHYLNGDTTRMNYVFPIYYSKKSEYSNDRIIFPIIYSFENDERTSLTVFPFYSHTENSLTGFEQVVYTPIYWNTSTPTFSNEIIFPLWWDTKRITISDTIEKTALFPIVWTKRSREENYNLIIPFVYRYSNPNYSIVNVFPLYSKGQSSDDTHEHFVLAPVYLHLRTPRTERTIAMPVYWNTSYFRELDTLRKVCVLPAYFLRQDAHQKSLTVLPLFHYSENYDTKETFLYCYPFYIRKADEHNVYTSIMPFYFDRVHASLNDFSHTTVLFPIYWFDQHNDMTNTVIFPIIYEFKNKEQESFTIFPLFSAGHFYDSTSSYFAATPFYWHFKNEASERNTLFPIYWNKQTYTSTDTVRSNVLFPLVWDKRSEIESSTYVFPSFYQHTSDSSRRVDVLPLYSFGKDLRTGKNHLMITPLFWQLEDKYAASTTFFPLYWHKQDHHTEDTVTTNVLFPLVWYKKNDAGNRTYVFPTIYRYTSDSSQRVDVLPLYSFGNDLRTGKSHLMISPVFWKLEDKYMASTTFFPLYWHKQDHHTKDTVTTNVLFPLVWNKKNDAGNKTYIFPLVYRFNSDSSQNLTVFPFYSAGKDLKLGKNYRMLTPLFWQHESPMGYSNVLFPLVWNSGKYLAHDSVYTNLVLPLFWSSRNNEGKNVVAFPFVYAYNNNYRHSLTLFPFFSYGYTSDSSSSHLAITPLYWQIKSPKASRSVLFPLWWNTSQYTNTDTLSTQLLFPLMWAKQSAGVDERIIYPFYYKFSNPHSYALTVLPIFSYRQNKDSLSSELITALYWHSASSKGEYTTLFPVYWDRKTYLKNDTLLATVLFPLYWYSKSLQSENRIAFPFYWNHYRYSEHDTTSQLALFPFYYEEKNKEIDRRAIFPVYFEKKQYNALDSSLARIVFPVYWHRQNKEAENTTWFPIYWQNKNSEEDNLTVLPFYRHHEFYTEIDTLVKQAWFPIYWQDKNRNKTRTAIFPIYYQREDHQPSDSSLATVIFPFYWHQENKFAENTTWFPIYWQNKNREEENLTVLPIYRHHEFYTENDTLVKQAWFPIYWQDKNRNKTRTAIFPIYYQREEHQPFDSSLAMVIFPFYWHQENKFAENTTWFPIYWQSQNREQSQLAVFPIYWQTKKYYAADTLKKEYIFPLVWSSRSKHENKKMVFPVLFYAKSDSALSFTFLPLMSYARNIDGLTNHLVVTPLFWNVNSKEKHTKLLFPLWWNVREHIQGDLAGVYHETRVGFPLYWYQKNCDLESTSIFPLYWNNTQISGNDTTRQLVLFPLFWQKKNKEFAKSCFFPLYWQNKQYLLSDTINKQTLFPLLWSSRSRTENKKVVFPLVFYNNNTDKQAITIFPLVYYKNDKRGMDDHLVIVPLLWNIENKDRSIHAVFPLWWNIHEKDSDLLSKKVFFPLYWCYNNYEEKREMILPLFYNIKNPDYHSYTLFPLFSFGHSPDSVKRHLMITPLFGSFASKNRSTSYLAPLLTYQKINDESNYSALFFLFRRTNGPDYSKTSVLWPLCEQSITRTNSSFRFAPFVWSSKTDTTRMLSVQPLFYSYSDSARKTFILSWILYKHESIKNTSVSANYLWKTYQDKRYANGDFEKRFLHLVYANTDMNGKREISVLPLFSKSRNKNGDNSFSLCFGLFEHFKEFKPEIQDFYEEERIFWFIRLRSNYRSLQAAGKEGFDRKKQAVKISSA